MTVKTTVAYTRASRKPERFRVAVITVRPAHLRRNLSQDREWWVLVESTLEPEEAITVLSRGWRVLSVRWLNRGEQRAAAHQQRQAGGGA